MRIQRRPSAGARARAGLSIVEVTIALLITGTVLAGTSGAFLSNFAAARTADALTEGSLFLESVLENLAAQSYDDLPAFHGNLLFDGEALERSRFTVRLSVFESEVGLLQIDAILSEARNGKEYGRVTTYRSQR